VLAPASRLPDVARPSWVDAALGDATGRGVGIGLIDSGLDPDWREPAFAPGVGLLARDGGDRYELAPSADAADRVGHGTRCASILREMAPGAEIVPIRVFDDKLVTSVPVLIAAVRWAVERRLAVVNLSLGTHLFRAIRPLYAACEEARRAGTVVVAAVDRSVSGSYPAVFANVLGVEEGLFDSAWAFRYRPDHAVECVASGRRRVRTLGGGRVVVDASSFAAPHVAALAALLAEREPGAGLDSTRAFLAHHALPTTR
jgi:subtilisin family serine protease